MTRETGQPRVVIIGGGFAGLAAARQLRRTRADIVVLDRRNHHLFQPLLYQVATAALSPSQIAVPIRTLFSRDQHIRVVMGEATTVDAESRVVRSTAGDWPYDSLIIAAGTRAAYFGHDAWRSAAPGLKSIEDALEIRRRFLLCFEEAEREEDPAHRAELMTFVVVGGGPTGVELAGALAEIAIKSLPRDFRHADTTGTRIVLVEAGPRVLPSFDTDQSDRARRDLEQMGVEVRLATRAESIERRRVVLMNGDGRSESFSCGAVFWAAGMAAETVAGSIGASHTRDGRIEVLPDLSVPGHPEVFAVGDVAKMVGASGREVPGVAQGAMQSGRHAGRIVAEAIKARLSGAEPMDPADRPVFRYRDKGNLATIGRRRAVADLGWIKLAGMPAWLLWAVVHIAFLVGFRNKLVTMFEWAYAYITFRRGARLITEPVHSDSDQV